MWFYACWNYYSASIFLSNGVYLPVSQNIRIALMLYGKVVSDYNFGYWDSTCLTFILDTPMVFCQNTFFPCSKLLQHTVVKLNLAAFLRLPCFIWLHPFFFLPPIRLWLFREILWNANGAKQNVIAAVWWLRGRTNDVPTPGSGRV